MEKKENVAAAWLAGLACLIALHYAFQRFAEEVGLVLWTELAAPVTHGVGVASYEADAGWSTYGFVSSILSLMISIRVGMAVWAKDIRGGVGREGNVIWLAWLMGTTAYLAYFTLLKLSLDHSPLGEIPAIGMLTFALDGAALCWIAWAMYKWATNYLTIESMKHDQNRLLNELTEFRQREGFGIDERISFHARELMRFLDDIDDPDHLECDARRSVEALFEKAGEMLYQDRFDLDLFDEPDLNSTAKIPNAPDEPSEELIDRFYEELDIFCPEWEQLNEDAGFRAWVRAADPGSSMTRGECLKVHERDLGAAAAASYFLRYRAETRGS